MMQRIGWYNHRHTFSSSNKGSESSLSAAASWVKSEPSRPPCALSWAAHTPPGSISSTSPPERHAPGCGAWQTPASDRPPLESSSVSVSKDKQCQTQKHPVLEHRTVKLRLVRLDCFSLTCCSGDSSNTNNHGEVKRAAGDDLFTHSPPLCHQGKQHHLAVWSCWKTFTPWLQCSAACRTPSRVTVLFEYWIPSLCY